MKADPDFRNLLIFMFSVVLLVYIGYILFEKSNNRISLPKPKEEQYDTLHWCRITSYQNDPWQTDSRPNETASGMNITADMFWEGQEYGYCAVSRDLLNFKLNFYDTVYVPIEDSVYGFVVIDCMNRRFTNSVDILTDYNILKTSKIWFHDN